MQIKFNTNLTFKRQLHTSEEAEFSSVLKEGTQKVGNTGKRILIIPSTSLPQNIETGVGNMLDKEALKFFDFAKLYWGINNIQLLPEGSYNKGKKGVYAPYSGSALDLGTQLINIELLGTKNYGELLSRDDIRNTIISTKPHVKNNFVVFENVLDKESSNEKALRKAFEELKKSDSDIKKQLLAELETYKIENKEWLEPKGIYEALSTKYANSDYHHWNDFDKNLYNTEIVSLKKRNKAIEGIKNSDLGKEVEFFEFKQFLAEKHLNEAKNELNKKGIKLNGDALIGFSKDEVWANPKAFIKHKSVGWGLPALNYDVPEGENLLRLKFKNYAKRYDGLRIDASWIYVAQPNIDNHTKYKTKKEYASKILDIIDDEILKVKGKNFDLENIMHEFVANLEDFDIYENGQIKPFVDKRNKIYCTNGMHDHWGTVNNFTERGWSKDSYTLGTTNHDCNSMRNQYASSLERNKQADVLSKILKIQKGKLSKLNEFIKAKFAEPLRAKNNMIFFLDALNLPGRYKDNPNRADDYRIKINADFQKKYIKSLEQGEGYNIMDALEKAFIADGLDRKEPELFNKIVKYRKILQEKSPANSNKALIIIGLAVITTVAATLYCINNKSNQHQDKI